MTSSIPSNRDRLSESAAVAERLLRPRERWLLALLVSLPLLLLVERIGRWGVDAPYIDQWSMVEDLDKYSRGAWTIDDLLRSHNGHRLVLLRLVLVPLAFLTGWNARVEMFLGVAVAASTFALLALSLRRALGAGPTFAACVFLAGVASFSLSQWENWTWGFQLNVALAVFFALLALTSLCREASWSSTTLAVASAALSSFSQAAGLVTWPAGLALLVAVPGEVRSKRGRIAAWVAAGVVIVAFYAWPRIGDAGAPRPSAFALTHPADYLAFVLTVIGGPVVSFTGAPWPPHDRGVAAIVALAGLAVVGVSWHALRAQPEARRLLLPLLAVALWSVGVALQIGLGRAEGGRPQAMSSRYMSFATPFWLAVIGFLGALSLHRPRWRTVSRLALAAIGASLVVSSLAAFGEFEARWKAVWPALGEARQRRAPDRVLALLHPEVHQVRDRIDVLRRLRLSFFRDGFVLPVPAVPLAAFGQELEVRLPIPRFTAREVVRVTVLVRNPTSARWSALGRGGWEHELSVRLSYHWMAPEGGAVVVAEGLRTELPRDLPGGEQVEIRATVQAPDHPGRFLLRLTMVQEGVAWFDAQGAASKDVVVDVAAGR